MKIYLFGSNGMLGNYFHNYLKDKYEIIKSEDGNLKEYNIRGSLITQKGSV